ncbi:MAG: hypothetical protein J5929_01940 [Eubacterium sp.]|nr:hypothetical protein [Eubacterium sp.]
MNENIKINGYVLRNYLTQNGLKANILSRTVLHERDGYLTDAINKGSIKKDYFEVLCDGLRIPDTTSEAIIKNKTKSGENHKSTDEQVKIDVEKLKTDLDKSGITANKLSTVVLNKSKSYLSLCFGKEYMYKDDLITLCDFLNMNPEDYIIQEIIKEPVEKTKLNESDASMEALNGIVKELDLILDEFRKNNEVLTGTLKALQDINEKVGKIEQKQHSLENALGQIVSKNIQISEDINDSKEHLRSIKSSTAIISGRTKDIYDKLTEKKYQKAM